MLHVVRNQRKAEAWNEHVLKDGALEIVVMCDQLPGFRVGCDTSEFNRRRICRQPQLRLIVVDRIDQAERLSGRIDRINVSAAVA
jgi:hypothetical protein